MAPLSREAAERLAQLIEQTGLSGRQFAAEIGLYDEDLNLLVNEKRTATGEKLLAIRNGLNRLIPDLQITVDELLEPGRTPPRAIADGSPDDGTGPGPQDPHAVHPGAAPGAIEQRESAGGFSDPRRSARPAGGDDRKLPPVVWYRVYLWGIRVDPRDPRRSAEAPRGSYILRPVAVGEETERVGAMGFGLLLNDASLSNWEGSEGQSLDRGWILWCNPDTRPGVQEGDLVVTCDPTKGLVAGVYREGDESIFLEADDAGVLKQERRRIKAEDVVGPVVMASQLASVPRRRERRATAGDNAG